MSIKANWELYRKTVLSDLTDEQAAGRRTDFYAGAISTFGEVTSSENDTEEKTAKVLEALEAECAGFYEEQLSRALDVLLKKMVS